AERGPWVEQREGQRSEKCRGELPRNGCCAGLWAAEPQNEKERDRRAFDSRHPSRGEIDHEPPLTSRSATSRRPALAAAADRRKFGRFQARTRMSVLRTAGAPRCRHSMLPLDRRPLAAAPFALAPLALNSTQQRPA